MLLGGADVGVLQLLLNNSSQIVSFLFCVVISCTKTKHCFQYIHVHTTFNIVVYVLFCLKQDSDVNITP